MAKDLKFKKVPCVEVDLSYDKERELNVRLNKNTGSFDFDILADMFDVDELTDWGFNEEELFGLTEPEYDELIGDDKEKPLEIKIKLKNINDYEKCINEVEKIIKMFDGCTYSVSGGEL